MHRTLVAWSFLLLGSCLGTAHAPTPPPAVAEASARLLEQALDREALFTFAGGLKPVSGGYWSGWIDVARPDLTTVRAVREQVRAWQDDTLWADVHVFDQVHDGRRAAQAYVVDRAALAEALARHAAFFAPYGLTPDAHPAEVAAVVERMPPADRHRGQGLLFGYPVAAVDFFVAASTQATADGKPAPRRFVQIPTHAADAGHFVYAVPPDHADSEADLRLRADAAAILARYRELRADARPGDLEAWLRIVRTLRAEFAPRAAASTAPATPGQRAPTSQPSVV